MSESEEVDESMQVALDFVDSIFKICDDQIKAKTASENKTKKQRKVITTKHQKKINNNSTEHRLIKKEPKKNLTIATSTIHKNYLTKQPDHTPSLNNNYLTNNGTYRAKYQNHLEKKIYQDKLLLLKNHINKLKMQEEKLNKKVEQARMKEKAKLERQKEKENLKQTLLIADIDKRNELEQKKKYILRQKIKSDLKLREKKERSLQSKINQFQELKSERQIANEEAIQYQQKEEAKIKKQIEKIKTERENIKNNNYKKNLYIDNDEYTMQEELENQKLRKEISKLENEELKCMESLRKTQENLLSEPYFKNMDFYNGENIYKKFDNKKKENKNSGKNGRAQSTEFSNRRRKKFADHLTYSNAKGKKIKIIKH